MNLFLLFVLLWTTKGDSGLHDLELLSVTRTEPAAKATRWSYYIICQKLSILLKPVLLALALSNSRTWSIKNINNKCIPQNFPKCWHTVPSQSSLNHSLCDCTTNSASKSPSYHKYEITNLLLRITWKLQTIFIGVVCPHAQLDSKPSSSLEWYFQWS